jgi:hypothetical protein
MALPFSVGGPALQSLAFRPSLQPRCGLHRDYPASRDGTARNPEASSPAPDPDRRSRRKARSARETIAKGAPESATTCSNSRAKDQVRASFPVVSPAPDAGNGGRIAPFGRGMATRSRAAHSPAAPGARGLRNTPGSESPKPSRCPSRRAAIQRSGELSALRSATARLQPPSGEETGSRDDGSATGPARSTLHRRG